MIDISKWKEYTPEQKKKKLPWILLVVIIWIAAFLYWLILN